MKHVMIVTGASSGMGAEFARQIAAEHEKDNASQKTNGSVSHELWLIARNKEALEALASEIRPHNHTLCVRTFALDISGRQGTDRFSQLLENETAHGAAPDLKTAHGVASEFKVDIIVNNAGFGTYGPFAETDINRELDMIDLNCTSLTGICGLILPYLSKGSRIINVASLASFLPLGNFAVYGATKSFVLSFTMALAAELKDKGIKVCALCPGPVSTNFANVASNGARKIVRHGLDPKKVVAHCLKKSKKGNHTAIMALKWKFKAAASRFVGRYAGARFTYLFCKRPHTPTV